MIRSIPILPSQDPSSDDEDLMATRKKLEHLTAGIEEITNESHRWEVCLIDGIQAWRYYQESLRLATQWIHRAESLLMAEKNANAQQSLVLHVAFFNSINKRLVNNLQTSSAQLLQGLPADSMRKMTVSMLRKQPSRIGDGSNSHRLGSCSSYEIGIFTGPRRFCSIGPRYQQSTSGRTAGALS